MTKIQITGGIDVGNGYVKAALRGDTGPHRGKADKFDIPSGVALVTGAVDMPSPDSAATEILAGDLFNELDVTFASQLVDSTHRHLFGRRALKATTPRFEEFDVMSGTSKAEQSLAKVLILGLVAGKAVRDFVAQNGVLPQDQVDVSVRIALALPIDEFREHRFAYKAGFEKGFHIVTVLNFETAVTVKVVFEDVTVFAEGASAQYAIRSLGVELIDGMVADVRKQAATVGAADPLEGLTSQDIFDAKFTVGIDIGEGTVNFPVYTDGKFNVDASRTFSRGYGTVLMNSLMPLKRAKLPFNSRKALADYLLSAPSPMKRAEHEKVAAIVAEQAALFAEQVVEEFRKVFAEVGRDTEVVYVFGGGSGPVQASLQPMLNSVVAVGLPVMFLDTTYSRHLNREGLLIVANKLEESAAKQAPVVAPVAPRVALPVAAFAASGV